MPVNDLDAIKDAELYDRLLNEFPRWLEKARENHSCHLNASDADRPAGGGRANADRSVPVGRVAGLPVGAAMPCRAKGPKNAKRSNSP